MRDRKEKNVNQVIVISTFVIFAIAMVFITLYVTTYKKDNSNYFKKYNATENNELADLLDKQASVDEKIKEVSENEEYTFEEPYLIVNPYKISPLSALIIFHTSSDKSIKVYINDEYIYKTEKSKKHIIPIYGLYANAINIVTLKMDDEEKNIEVKTNSYNFNTSGIDIKEHLDDKTHYFLLGDIQDKYSNIRGFDHNGNLLFFLDLDYISSVKFYNNHFYVGYNSKYSKNTNLTDIKLELDYLGKIYSIANDLNDLETEPNLESEDKSFIGASINLYKDTVNNYVIKSFIDSTEYTTSNNILTEDIRDFLDEAKIYDKKFKIASNGEYLTYDFDEKNAHLLLVNKNSQYTYEYDINDTNIIKANIKGEASLYLTIGDSYYSLLTTIKN